MVFSGGLLYNINKDSNFYQTSFNKYCTGRSKMDIIEIIKQTVKQRKNRIKIIPDNTIIEPSLLGTMTNKEYVATFKRFQETVILMYDEIERNPEKYGFILKPDQINSNTIYYRLCDFLFCYLLLRAFTERWN